MSEKDLTTAATIEYPQDTINSMAKKLSEEYYKRQYPKSEVLWDLHPESTKDLWRGIAVDALNWVVEP